MILKDEHKLKSVTLNRTQASFHNTAELFILDTPTQEICFGEILSESNFCSQTPHPLKKRSLFKKNQMAFEICSWGYFIRTYPRQRSALWLITGFKSAF